MFVFRTFLKLSSVRPTFIAAFFLCPWLSAAAAQQEVPTPETPASTKQTPADESPMMLYLVPWNANPETNKNAKKFTLYQPWGQHFDPLTPEQTSELSSQ